MLGLSNIFLMTKINTNKRDKKERKIRGKYYESNYGKSTETLQFMTIIYSRSHVEVFNVGLSCDRRNRDVWLKSQPEKGKPQILTVLFLQ